MFDERYIVYTFIYGNGFTTNKKKISSTYVAFDGESTLEI